MSYKTNSYDLESSNAELTISLSNGMSIKIPPNSKIAGYYAIKVSGNSSCILCFQNDRKEGLGIVDVPYQLLSELEDKLTQMSN